MKTAVYYLCCRYNAFLCHQGVHTAGDYVASLATDVNNDYLFTGTTVGYIKVWLMTNYMINEEVSAFIHC